MILYEILWQNWNKTLKFYNSVFDLFEFYESQLNLNIFNIKYENVVYDFENQRTILRFY